MQELQPFLKAIRTRTILICSRTYLLLVFCALLKELIKKVDIIIVHHSIIMQRSSLYILN